MSEYQFVHFLAVDRPLDDEQLEYMESQSSRANVSRWEFTNEYHFGDFHGNAKEMLQRGFDVHLHFANFGIRKLMFRIPLGLPCDKKTFAAFRPEYGVTWHADKSGPGGLLEIEPEADAGTYDSIYAAAELLPAIAPVRELLMAGDLRPLYVAWLACGGDDDATEPPVPAGLEQLPPSLQSMAEFYEVSDELITAAADRSPPAPALPSDDQQIAAWIAKRSADELRELGCRLLGKDAGDIRSKTLAQIRAESGAATWPLTEPGRTLGQLRSVAERILDERFRQAEEARATARRQHLAEIAANTLQAIANIERLVKIGSTKNYEQAAQELADLREALGPERGPETAHSLAQQLKDRNPKRNRLSAALKRHGLLKHK